MTFNQPENTAILRLAEIRPKYFLLKAYYQADIDSYA